MESRLFDSGYPMRIGDAEYTASSLCDKDYGDLDNYIKATYVAIAESASVDLPPDRRKELITIALSNSLAVGWDTEEGDKILYSGLGILRIGFQMIRKRHPTVQYKEFHAQASKNMIEAVRQIETVYSALTRILTEDIGGTADAKSKSES